MSGRELRAVSGRRPRVMSGSRARVLTATLGLLLLAGVALVVVDPFAASGKGGGTIDNSSPTALARIVQRSLTSQRDEAGTLGYAGDWSAVNEMTGTITHLPSIGEVVRPGHVLYGVSGNPVVLLRGGVPSYRSLSEGMEGRDVSELNADLLAMGYADGEQIEPGSDYFGSGTRYALGRLQHKLGEQETGTLSLGEAVFLPGAARITKLSATLGSQAAPGGPIAEATSTRRRVVVELDAAAQTAIRKGDAVTITLPDERQTPGVVSSVGKVATSPSSNPGEPGGPPTIEVEIAPKDPKATGHLDQAPVEVSITTARARSALVVPVDALLALAGGGYALEAVEGRVHRLEPVSVGLFDDAEGIVQVSGSQLRAGQRIVVPKA